MTSDRTRRRRSGGLRMSSSAVARSTSRDRTRFLIPRASIVRAGMSEPSLVPAGPLNLQRPRQPSNVANRPSGAGPQQLPSVLGSLHAAVEPNGSEDLLLEDAFDVGRSDFA